MTFAISFGKWGGFYMRFKHNWRVCLGWVCFTVLFVDIDKLLDIVDTVGKLVAEAEAKKLAESDQVVTEILTTDNTTGENL